MHSLGSPWWHGMYFHSICTSMQLYGITFWAHEHFHLNPCFELLGSFGTVWLSYQMQRIKPNCAGKQAVPRRCFFRLKPLIKGDLSHALYRPMYPLSIWIDFPIRQYDALISFWVFQYLTYYLSSNLCMVAWSLVIIGFALLNWFPYRLNVWVSLLCVPINLWNVPSPI
jgi:hypothetical protein